MLASPVWNIATVIVQQGLSEPQSARLNDFVGCGRRANISSDSDVTNEKLRRGKNADVHLTLDDLCIDLNIQITSACEELIDSCRRVGSAKWLSRHNGRCRSQVLGKQRLARGIKFNSPHSPAL